MQCFRISKYDPKKRLEDGSYSVDEWTSFSDIGSSFQAGTLTEAEYERVEAAYVTSALDFLEEAEVDALRVVSYENYGGYQSQVDLNGSLSGDMLRRALVEVLREHWWGKFEADQCYIHIGYDFYMYVGVPKSCTQSRRTCVKRGLYVECVDSPYWDE